MQIAQTFPSGISGAKTLKSPIESHGCSKSGNLERLISSWYPPLLWCLCSESIVPARVHPASWCLFCPVPHFNTPKLRDPWVRIWDIAALVLKCSWTQMHLCRVVVRRRLHFLWTPLLSANNDGVFYYSPLKPLIFVKLLNPHWWRVFFPNAIRCPCVFNNLRINDRAVWWTHILRRYLDTNVLRYFYQTA